MTNSDPCAPDYTAAVLQARVERFSACPAEGTQQEQPEKTVPPYPLAALGRCLSASFLRVASDRYTGQVRRTNHS